MEPSEFLDILGNENRRKIIALLAERPYYVSEITTRLNVSPKAVIGHLSLLENSALIESSTDAQRRKYYSISKSLRLEVSVSPYSYSVHVNNIKLEMPEDPVYSLSLSFDAPRSKQKSKSKKTKDIPTGPVIHLASFYDSKDVGGEKVGNEEDKETEGGGFTIEIIGPSHPFYEHVGLLHGDAGKKYLGTGTDVPPFDSKSKRLSEDELNTVYDDGAYEKHEPEIIFPNREGAKGAKGVKGAKGAKNSSENSDDNPDADDETEPSRLQSREGYFLSRIFKVRDDLGALWEEQQELSRLQEELTVRQSRLMNSFVHYATQLSDDKVDLDIMFRLLKEDMSAAELCHATGHAPSLVLPRLMSFEEKKMVEKYLQSGDFMWRLKDGIL